MTALKNREKANTANMHTKTAGKNFTMRIFSISVCKSIIAYMYAAMPPIESMFNRAETIPIPATVRNFAISRSLFLTGSVSTVSKVPLSRSPAVVSIAGYMVPIKRLTISMNGRIVPIMLPRDCSLLAVFFFP